MKRIIISLAMATLLMSNLYAAEPVKTSTKKEVKVELNGHTFKAQSGAKASQESAKKTDYLWEDSKGNTYPIWISKNGKAFVKKVSKKTGNEYNYYLPEEVAKQILK